MKPELAIEEKQLAAVFAAAFVFGSDFFARLLPIAVSQQIAGFVSISFPNMNGL
ncbi:MAG: hypothetical protein ACKVZH_24720 [Blastocatellia bacterium]